MSAAAPTTAILFCAKLCVFDGSERGHFTGTMDYTEGLQLRATNSEGTLLTATPLHAISQIEVRGWLDGVWLPLCA